MFSIYSTYTYMLFFQTGVDSSFLLSEPHTHTLLPTSFPNTNTHTPKNIRPHLFQSQGELCKRGLCDKVTDRQAEKQTDMRIDGQADRQAERRALKALVLRANAAFLLRSGVRTWWAPPCLYSFH